jgi:hypothetical protein
MRAPEGTRTARIVGMFVILAALAGWQPPASAAESERFYDLLEPLPGTVATTVAPPITGDDAADRRIRALAEERGYRLRSRHVGRLVTAAGVPVAARAAGPLQNLIAEAGRAGHPLTVAYGHRSVDHQRLLFRHRLAAHSNEELASGEADHAIDAALMWVAPPGYSKHHSGHAVDFRSGEGSAVEFGTSPVGLWLAADDHAVAKRFGFLPSYPAGAGAQGPEPEPWEYVYVGTAAIHCSPILAGAEDRRAYDACLVDLRILAEHRAKGGARGFLDRVVGVDHEDPDPPAAADGARGRARVGLPELADAGS